MRRIFEGLRGDVGIELFELPSGRIMSMLSASQERLGGRHVAQFFEAGEMVVSESKEAVLAAARNAADRIMAGTPVYGPPQKGVACNGFCCPVREGCLRFYSPGTHGDYKWDMTKEECRDFLEPHQC